ncbi:hypothetical protein RND71_016033 [Anisodus tanguticus]|uniref:Protein kinase domain-containing protein n=1 Tax=Anisodus tanguticus TaxID=243964 RepID=A0AAE1VLQ0_9SOLA|nr:hypothetical protein RND71_016033 [Anisodus tanguticus]
MPLDEHGDLNGDIVVKSVMDNPFDNFRKTLQDDDLETFFRDKCFGMYLYLPEDNNARFQMTIVLRCHAPSQHIPTVMLKKRAYTPKSSKTVKKGKANVDDDLDLVDVVGKSYKVVYPWLVPIKRELNMSCIVTLGPVESVSEKLIDQIKEELAGATTIIRESRACVVDGGDVGVGDGEVKIDSSSLCASAAAVKCADFNRSISLQQEAQILTTLKGCPYVVQFFGADISIDNGNIPTYSLFLEYACDESLHDLINSKRGITNMSELEVGFYAYQLLKGIQHVHKKGWVHCDIKSDANDEHGGMHKLKLADFGLSLRVGDGMAYIMNEDPVIPSNVSEIARDFLYKCFIKDPRRRWTSEQLLQHPFIQRALCTSFNLMPETQGRIARVNPFGCTLPVPEKDLMNLLFESSLKIQ